MFSTERQELALLGGWGAGRWGGETLKISRPPPWTCSLKKRELEGVLPPERRGWLGRALKLGNSHAEYFSILI